MLLILKHDLPATGKTEHHEEDIHMLKHRIAKLVRAIELPSPTTFQRRMADVMEEVRREREEFLTHIPADLRGQVAAAMVDPKTEDEFAEWTLWPFDAWAGSMSPKFEFPRVMVEWILRHTGGFAMFRGCERCGMRVPIAMPEWVKPSPVMSPAERCPFPQCPACGGPTSNGGRSSTRSGPQVSKP